MMNKVEGHIRSLELKVGNTLLGENEEGATEYGTALGRRIVIGLILSSELVVVDAESPSVIRVFDDIPLMDEEELYSLRTMEVSDQDIGREIRSMVDYDLIDDPDQVLDDLDSGATISRDIVIRAITRICEQNESIFPDKRPSARETYVDVMNNNGVNSDPEMIAELTCGECFMINRYPVSSENPCCFC